MKPCLFIFITCLVVSASAQENQKEDSLGWNKEAVGMLNVSQTHFDNWQQGGENAWSWMLDSYAKFVSEQAVYQWANNIQLSYGRTRVEGSDSRKASDEIRMESVLTYKIARYLNPYIAVIGLTQFSPGYKYSEESKTKISNFLDPGFFTQSAGMGYQPNKYFKTRLGASLKETVTRDHGALYTDDKETETVEKYRIELGAESVTDLDIKLADNILYTSKVELFSNFKGLDQIDINWHNLFSSKISALLSVNFDFRLFYDRDISAKRQLKQILAVGVTYRFY
jgi:hypothetical protein